MVRPTPGWSAPLSWPIFTPDGKRLATLADAHDIVLALPGPERQQAAWQTADKLLTAAAERGGDIRDATAQVQIALYLQARGGWPLPHQEKPQ